MKRNILHFGLYLLLFAGVFTRTMAQKFEGSIERSVVGSAGTTAGQVLDGATNPPLYTLEWTMGEVFTEVLKGSKKQLTQGFHQDFWASTSVIKISTYKFSALDQEDVKEHFSVFPNPFVSSVSVNWHFEENLNLLFEIYALDGKRLFVHRQNSEAKSLLIYLNNLSPQTYVLRVSDPSRGFVETHKITKL